MVGITKSRRRRLASVVSLVEFRSKLQSTAGNALQVVRSGFRNDVWPLGDGSPTDLQGARHVDRLLEMGNHFALEHEPMLTIVPSWAQPYSASYPLTLVDMKDWKDCKTLIERLQWAMDRASVNQSALAEACHISTAAVSKWFNDGTKNLKHDNLFAVATLLVVNPRWLAIGEDTPFTGIPSAYTEIAGSDLEIARALTGLNDKNLRITINELIQSKKAKQADSKPTKRRQAQS